jgi:hypothetical protein
MMLPGVLSAPPGPSYFDPAYEPFRERIDYYLRGKVAQYPYSFMAMFQGDPFSVTGLDAAVVIEEDVVTTMHFHRWEFIQHDPTMFYYAAHDAFGRWVAGALRPTREAMTWT